MKLKMLPNWCKKLGFLLFIVCIVISGYEGFMKGFTAAASESKEFVFFGNYFSESFLHFLEVLSILGMIIYMFSREKIEDDYINKLRLESYQLTAIMGLVVTIMLYTFSKDLELTLDYFLILFLWTYLIIFALKKRTY